MKFNDINLIRNPEVSAPVAETGAGGGSNVVKVQIDWTQAPSINNPKSAEQIVEYINTLAKDMNPADVLKAVREQFGVSPAIDDVQLKAYIDNSKQIYTTLHPETLEQAQNVEYEVTDELSAMMTEYAKKYGLEEDIDVIRAHILTNGPDPLAKDIIAQLDGNNEIATVKHVRNVSPDMPDNVISKAVVSASTLKDPQFKRKAIPEQAYTVMEEYLSKTDPNFDKLSDKEKKEVIKSNFKSLMEVLGKLDPGSKNKKFEKLSEKEIKSIIGQSMLLLQVSYDKQLSLSDLAAMDVNQLKSLMSDSATTFISGIYNEIKDESITDSEKINFLFDKMLETMDSSYAKKSDSEKAKMREQHIANMLIKAGILKDGQKLSDIKDPVFKSNVEAFMLSLFKGVANGDESIADLMKVTSYRMQDRFAKYCQKNIPEGQRNNKENKNLIRVCDDIQLKNHIIYSIIKSNPNLKPEDITNQQIYDWLNTEGNLEGIPSELKTSNSALSRLNKFYEEMMKSPHKDYLLKQKTLEQSTVRMEAAVQGKDPCTIVNADVDYILKNGGLDKNFEYVIQRYMTEPALFNQLMQMLEDQEVDTTAFKEKFKNLNLDEYNRVKSVSSGVAEEIEAARQITNRGYYNTGTQERLVDNYENISQYLDSAEAEKLSKLSAQDPNFENTPYFDAFYGQGIHGYGKEDAARILSETAKAEGVSDSYKSRMTQTAVETASAERQAYYASELSKSGNEAVIKGLEAASSSVDPSVRSQYEASVAAGAARVAESSGNSSRTAETTVTNSANQYESSKTNADVTSPTVAKTVTTTPSTVAQSTPTVTTPISTSTTYSTVTNNFDIDAANAKTAAALEEKRDIVAENIQEFVDEVQEETSAYEVGLTQDVAEEVAEILDEVTEEGTISADSQARLKELIQTSDIGAIYSQIVALKGANVIKAFVSTLAIHGSHDQVVAFASAYKNDKGLMEEIFNHAGADLKMKLIKAGVISRELVLKMLASGAITDFDGIDPDIILQYVQEHLADFKHNLDALKMYLPYIPIEHHQYLMNQLNQLRGVTEETAQPEQETMATEGVDPVTGLPVNSTPVTEEPDEVSTVINDTPQVASSEKKDKTASTLTSENPELDDENDMFTNPLLVSDEPEGTSPDGRLRADDITLRTGMTLAQQRQNRGIVQTPEKGSDAWFASIMAQRGRYDDEASGQYPPTLANWKIKHKKPPKNWT